MTKAKQVLVSFSISKDNDLAEVRAQMKEGWRIVSLVSMGKNYVGIMEKMQEGLDKFHLPARKKLRLVK